MDGDTGLFFGLFVVLVLWGVFVLYLQKKQARQRGARKVSGTVRSDRGAVRNGKPALFTAEEHARWAGVAAAAGGAHALMDNEPFAFVDKSTSDEPLMDAHDSALVPPLMTWDNDTDSYSIDPTCHTRTGGSFY